VDVSCSPGKYNYFSPPIACCEVTHNLIITSEYEPLNIIGYNNKFKGFIADQKSISYLPSGIEKCCGSVEVLMIKNSSLKDITASNLRSFPDITILDLSFNKIRILDEGLFQYNLKIKILYLNGNQISAMVPTVFDNNLQELKYLYIDGNQCQAKITIHWINKEPFIEFPKGKDDCTNNGRLTITRNIVKIEKVEDNLKYVYDMNSKMANILNLESRLIKVEHDIENLTSTSQVNNGLWTTVNNTIDEKHAQLKDLIKEKIHEPKLDTFGYLNSFLLFSILAVQLFIIFRNKKCSQSPKSTSEPQIIEPNDVTTVSQLDDDDTSVEPHPRDAYDYFINNESHSNSGQAAQKYEYTNEIYGTTIVEDLYSDAVSPNTMKSCGKINEESSLYAVVFKPQRK